MCHYTAAALPTPSPTPVRTDSPTGEPSVMPTPFPAAVQRTWINAEASKLSVSLKFFSSGDATPEDAEPFLAAIRSLVALGGAEVDSLTLSSAAAVDAPELNTTTTPPTRKTRRRTRRPGRDSGR